ncbi:HDOD domain-containing protein [Atopomonas sediminilitoris]|uniref:HDOD domain-containing protein n=1 Tax=Atopomonas sediminilitoris TaxID=2919919 RepID=UPI001F4D93C4|nr:HDOD domain-containing protein [Atopomonas sediminilitoris]MCJ8169334.1 HDOD domain-containing protein [Atopomonas sediminilitoris]
MQVLIIEDDPWMAELLASLVRNQRRDAAVTVCQDGMAGWQHWSQHGAELILSDWNMPGLNGLDLLERVRKHEKQQRLSKEQQAPFIMVTARNDRRSVMEAVRFGLTDFIAKPFSVGHVLERLKPYLGEGPSTASGLAEQSLLEYLERLSDEELELPLSPSLQETLERSIRPEQQDFATLNALWQRDPAITARLLAAANSGDYYKGGDSLTTLAQALQRLGLHTSLNLALGVALAPASGLQEPVLRERGEALWNQVRTLAELCQALARQVGDNPEEAYTAALLSNLGELVVLYEVQSWLATGQTLTDADLAAALDRFSRPFSAALKANWRLPLSVRQRIGALYGMGGQVTAKADLVMRSAYLLQQPEDSREDGLDSCLRQLNLGKTIAEGLLESVRHMPQVAL